ncbi:hypothetical protein D3C86_1964310 [compost metagenome]
MSKSLLASRTMSAVSAAIGRLMARAIKAPNTSTTAITPRVIAALVMAACMKIACTVVISTPLAIVQPQGAKACA